MSNRLLFWNMRRKNDILLKSAFEEAFPDLLRFYFKQADSIFDIGKGFEFMDKELGQLFPELETKGGSRFVDMLVKTYLKSGAEEWILVHIEIQGEDTREFAKRMFTYYYRIYDRYNVNIAALAVFTGGPRQKRPGYFHENFLGTEVLYKFSTYHILDHTEEQLTAFGNPFAFIILAAQKVLLTGKIPEQELGMQRLTVARALIASKKYNNEQIRRFLFFLKTFIHIDNEEINRIFDIEINILTGNVNAMGIIETIKMITLEEGIEQGIEKGEQKKGHEVVSNLLLLKQFSISEIANIANVTEDFVVAVQSDLKI
jgi:predicted transposase/invertase (TIGR01784 family)